MLNNHQPINRFAKKLVLDELLTEAAAKKYVAEAQSQQVSLVTYLVRRNIISSETLASIASIEFELPLLDLLSFNITTLPLHLVNQKLICKHQALPLFQRNTILFVAMSDPTHISALEDFKFHTGLHTQVVLVEEHKVSLLITQIFQNIANISPKTALDNLALATISHEDVSILHYLQDILRDAVTQRASDIHLEPYATAYRIRFRQDGLLYEKATPPLALAERFTTCLKIMAQLDIAERRLPQDGRFKLDITSDKTIDFRISTCPTLYGEKMVVRILDNSHVALDLDKLGFEPSQKQHFLQAMQQPQGLILVTGPTGSGKTTSLYTALHYLNKIHLNILSVEDPIEIHLAGINQVNIKPKIGLTFARVLRTFLRQDPDIIMVGEIRDRETAEAVIKAAQTGHLVFSTLHTNSGVETLLRLKNMGIAPYNLASSLKLIISQRLARQLCPACKTPISAPHPDLVGLDYPDSVEEITLFEAVGCKHCLNGYKNRTGIYEVIPINQTLESLILNKGSLLDMISHCRHAGFLTLQEAAQSKVLQGVTSLNEIKRIL